MAQIETYSQPSSAVALPFRAFGEVAIRFFRQIANRQTDSLQAQHHLSQPNVDSHMLWDHGMTRRDVARMLDRTHR